MSFLTADLVISEVYNTGGIPSWCVSPSCFLCEQDYNNGVMAIGQGKESKGKIRQPPADIYEAAERFLQHGDDHIARLQRQLADAELEVARARFRFRLQIGGDAGEERPARTRKRAGTP